MVPGDKENPAYREWPKVNPRFEKNRDAFVRDNSLNEKVISRVFKSTEGLPGNMRSIAGNLVSLYTSLPNIDHEGMMGDILTDADIVQHWETDNLGSYSWVFRDQNNTIPILKDFLKKADAVLDGTSGRIADFRFGHDSYIGPLTVLMGLDGADLDPEDPYEVKNVYQNWKTCKASTIHLVFYRGRHATDPILVKCLLNGYEVTLPVPTDHYPYYNWSDLRAHYQAKIDRRSIAPEHPGDSKRSTPQGIDLFVFSRCNGMETSSIFMCTGGSEARRADSSPFQGDRRGCAPWGAARSAGGNIFFFYVHGCT